MKKNQTHFKFDGESIDIIRFPDSAHTYDSVGWLLKEQKILHIPDLVNPNQMPYLDFGGSEKYDGFADNIKMLSQLDFDYFSGGHGNIGSKKDLDFMQPIKSL